MHHRTSTMNFALAFTAALTLPLTSAQYVVPKCDPCSSACAAAPALDNVLNVNFCQGQNRNFQMTRDGASIFYHKDSGAIMRISRENEAPELASQDYILYGRIEVHAKGAKGQGIASTIKLVNDNGGTLGYDLIGSCCESVKTNWQPKAASRPFINILDHKIIEPLDLYHNYTLEWTKKGATWYIDSQAVRYLPSEGHSDYPCLPMNLRLDIIPAGDSSKYPHEYVKWAGGVIDMSHGPFDFGVRLVKITNYSTGKQYAYRDQNCNAKSIEAVRGDIADENRGIGFIADRPANTHKDSQATNPMANRFWSYSGSQAMQNNANDESNSATVSEIDDKSSEITSATATPTDGLYQDHISNITKTTKAIDNAASTPAISMALIATLICCVAVPAMLGLVGEL